MNSSMFSFHLIDCSRCCFFFRALNTHVNSCICIVECRFFVMFLTNTKKTDRKIIQTEWNKNKFNHKPKTVYENERDGRKIPIYHVSKWSSRNVRKSAQVQHSRKECLCVFAHIKPMPNGAAVRHTSHS